MTIDYEKSQPVISMCDIKKEFSSDVDLIIDGGDIIGGISSTIAAVENGKIKVLRQGSVKIC